MSSTQKVAMSMTMIGQISTPMKALATGRMGRSGADYGDRLLTQPFPAASPLQPAAEGVAIDLILIVRVVWVGVHAVIAVIVHRVHHVRPEHDVHDHSNGVHDGSAGDQDTSANVAPGRTAGARTGAA